MQNACSHYNAFCSITWQTRLYLRTWQQKTTPIMQPFHCDLQQQIPSHLKTTHTHTQTHSKQLEATVTLRQRKNVRTTPVPPATHTSTLHGKTQGFVLRLPPQNKSHATFMQPLQCVLQPNVANPLLSTRMATENDNNHAAIPLRYATADSKPPYNYTRARKRIQNSLKPPLH